MTSVDVGHRAHAHSHSNLGNYFFCIPLIISKSIAWSLVGILTTYQRKFTCNIPGSKTVHCSSLRTSVLGYPYHNYIDTCLIMCLSPNSYTQDRTEVEVSIGLAHSLFHASHPRCVGLVAIIVLWQLKEASSSSLPSSSHDLLSVSIRLSQFPKLKEKKPH